jgi:hypothetical protein
MGLSKIRKRLFNFNFFGGILLLRQLCLFEISIKFLFFNVQYDLFQKIKDRNTTK